MPPTLCPRGQRLSPGLIGEGAPRPKTELQTPMRRCLRSSQGVIPSRWTCSCPRADVASQRCHRPFSFTLRTPRHLLKQGHLGTRHRLGKPWGGKGRKTEILSAFLGKKFGSLGGNMPPSGTGEWTMPIGDVSEGTKEPQTWHSFTSQEWLQLVWNLWLWSYVH